jgi:thiol:disulfide interchange protein
VCHGVILLEASKCVSGFSIVAVAFWLATEVGGESGSLKGTMEPALAATFVWDIGDWHASRGFWLVYARK